MDDHCAALHFPKVERIYGYRLQVVFYCVHLKKEIVFNMFVVLVLLHDSG